MVLATAYIWGTPFLRQVMHVHQPYARMWVMFGGYGRETCLVEFSTVRDGEVQPLDRFELFGHTERAHAPQWLRLVSNRDLGKGASARICRELGPEADLRMRLTCLHGDEGWRLVSDPTQNQCVDVPPKLERRR